MTIRPSHFQGTFNPATNRVESMTIVDCQTVVDPITDAEVVGATMARVCTEKSHPKLLAAINEEMQPSKSVARVDELRADFRAKLEAQKTEKLEAEAAAKREAEAAAKAKLEADLSVDVEDAK